MVPRHFSPAHILLYPLCHGATSLAPIGNEVVICPAHIAFITGFETRVALSEGR